MTTTHASVLESLRASSRAARRLTAALVLVGGASALEACAHPIQVAALKTLPSDEGTDSVHAVFRPVGRQIGKTYKIDLEFLVSLDQTWEPVRVWDAERGAWVDPPIETARRRSVTVAFGGHLKSDPDKCGWAIGTVTETNQGGSSWGDAIFAGGGYLKRREVPGFKREDGNPDGHELLAVGDVLPLDCAALDSAAEVDAPEPTTKKDAAFDMRQTLASLPTKTPEVCRVYAKTVCKASGPSAADQKRACERVVADVTKIASQPAAAKSCKKLQKSAAASKADEG